MIVFVLSVIAGGVTFWVYEHSRVYKVCHVEAGVPVEVADFLKIADAAATFTDESDVIDTVNMYFNKKKRKKRVL